MWNVKNCNECRSIASELVCEIQDLRVENSRLKTKIEELQKRADFLEKFALAKAGAKDV